MILVYHEFLPIGKALIYNEEDTKLGNELKKKKLLSSFDEDFLILLNFFKSDYFKSEFNGKIGCIGMCLGGHLSFRVGFLPEVTAIVCLFPTDIHNANLSLNGDDTLKRVKELEGNGKEVLMIFGKQDDHIPEKGRSIIYHSLKSIDCSWVEVNARHAFTRDEFSKGRYDPAMKDIALSLTQELFHRRLILGLPSLKDILPQPQSKL
ncbi:hypothetical protein HDU92_002553 [Lobulomyces angularis]|nr:hypothetical protein HDU92_002553 [Lobulomyces angularis]